MASAPSLLGSDRGNGIKPLRIGNREIGFPVIQAALSGYSDRAMRLIARRLGADYTLCEVMVDRLVIDARKKGLQRLHIVAEERPVGGQLMGAEPAEFAQAAKRLANAGFDVIDINFGCPVKKVLGRCRGGYLLGEPETALEIVARVREAVPADIPVTVKMRRGLDDSDKSRDQFFAIFDGAFARGVAAITVHGRTVRQRYIGPSRWSFVREVKAHAGSRTVLGSGDLFTAHQCLDMLRETGVDGVTAARGAIGNPWIFTQARALAAGREPEAPSLFIQREILAEHYRLAMEIYGPQRTGRMMRKFGIQYAKIHPQAAEVRQAFIHVQDLDDWQAALKQWYAEDLPGVLPKGHLGEESLDSCDAAA